MKKLLSSFISSALILVWFAGCRQASHKQDTATAIRFTQALSINLGQYLEQVHFIQLENTPESAFATVNKLIINKGLMFFFDNKLEAVFCFDTTGKFHFRIQHTGRGPGEYRHLSSVWINPESDELWIQSMWPRQMLVYDLQGNLLRYWPLEEVGDETAFLGPNRLATYRASSVKTPAGQDPGGITLTDMKGRLIRRESSFGDSSIFWRTQYERHFESFGNSQLLLSQIDTILRIGPDGRTQPDLIMDWGNLTVPGNYRKICFGDPDMDKLNDMRYLQGKDQLVAFGPIRIFRVYLNNTMDFALADLESKTGTYSTVITGDQAQLALIYPLTVSDSDELAGLYDMTVLYAMKDMLMRDRLEGPNGNTFRTFRSLVDSAIRNDRPIVWMAKIKSKWITKND